MHRVHSDRGSEYASFKIRHFLRNALIPQSFTVGDDPQGNGRAEWAVGELKRDGRRYMLAAKLRHEYWPYAIDYASAVRLSRALGTPMPRWAFGHPVLVRARGWTKLPAFAPRAHPARFLGPDSEGAGKTACIVVKDSGEIMHASSVYDVKGEDATDEELLSAGWKQEKDPEGKSFWKHKSGLSQREKPELVEGNKVEEEVAEKKKEEEEEIATWVEVSPMSVCFRTSKKAGPKWADVVKRQTFDADTNELLESCENPQERTKAQLYARIPGGPRNIRTELTYVIKSGVTKTTPREQHRTKEETTLREQHRTEDKKDEKDKEAVAEEANLNKHAKKRALKKAKAAEEEKEAAESGAESAAEIDVCALIANIKIQKSARRLDEGQEELALGEEEEAAEASATARIVTLDEVKMNLERWKPSMKAERDALYNKIAVSLLLHADYAEFMQQNPLAQTFPGKAVFTVKPGGRDKCRAVICGNYVTKNGTELLFTATIDACALRIALRECALQKWDAVSIDVSTAFLNAPLEQAEGSAILVRPPTVFTMAGLVPEESALRASPVATCVEHRARPPVSHDVREY